MKKPLLFTICIILLLNACKKNSVDIPSNTIVATIDGASESFNANVSAQLGTAISLNSNLLIFGSNGGSSGSDSMSITINSKNTIANGTYTNSASDNSGFTSILYNKGPFSLTNPTIYTTDVNGTYPSAVVITSITNTNIQGTFSGKLLFKDGITVKSVTNGKFNVDINK